MTVIDSVRAQKCRTWGQLNENFDIIDQHLDILENKVRPRKDVRAKQLLTKEEASNTQLVLPGVN